MTQIPRILIAAQDQQLCNFIQAALAPQGFMLLFIVPEVPIPDALAQIAADIVLIDTAHANGFEQCAIIKQHFRRQTTPILLLLHEKDSAVIGRGHDTQADDAFLLPGQPGELVLRVQTLLQRTRGTQPPRLRGASSPKKPMLRGFVHEVSNTLTSNMLVLATAFEHEKTLSVQNSENLYKLFERIEPFLPQAIREEVLDYLHRIDQNEETLDRVLRLLNDANDRAISYTTKVSEYGKLEYLPLTIQPLMLDRELAVVVKQYQEKFDERDISVTLDGVCTQPLFGHRPHIRALFDHLLNNAYEAFVSQSAVPSARITITFSDVDSAQHIRIHDNAGGIQPIHLPAVFEPFYTTHLKTHTGLGLCFAAKLVSLYRGTIALESTPEHGTSVEIAFPINPPVSAPIE